MKWNDSENNWQGDDCKVEDIQHTSMTHEIWDSFVNEHKVEINGNAAENDSK